jgi:RimK family alpha-L-glutamate ligase
MRLLLLTARPELDTNRRLAEASATLGVELTSVDAAGVVAVSDAGPALLRSGRNLLGERPDAVIARVGNWRPGSVLAALEVAVSAGAASPNPPEAIRVGRDHWRTVRRLREAGLPVPATLAGADPEQLAGAATSSLGFPCVVKQRRSRMGTGVVRCDARDHLEAVLDSLWRLGDEVVVQSFVDCGGASLRLLVVGDQVVASARFTAAAGEWRSNAACGGTAVAHSPTVRERELAIEAARELRLGQCGVDLLPGELPLVVEVNPTPGFLTLEDATGVDVAAAMVAHAIGL